MVIDQLEPISTGDMSLDALRVDVAAACRLAALYQWDDHLANHVSVRVPGTDNFLINPLGLLFSEVTAGSVLEVDEHGTTVSGRPINAAGFVVHSAVHMARPDVHAVIHLHTNETTAVGVTRSGLLNLSPFSMAVHPVAYHDWEGVTVEADERLRLAEHLAESSVMFLRNHGILAVGRTMAEAFQRAYFVQRRARCRSWRDHSTTS